MISRVQSPRIIIIADARHLHFAAREDTVRLEPEGPGFTLHRLCIHDKTAFCPNGGKQRDGFSVTVDIGTNPPVQRSELRPWWAPRNRLIDRCDIGGVVVESVCIGICPRIPEVGS